MQEVEITIEAGTPTIKVNGVKGPACLKATAQLEKDLGGVASRKSTKEMTSYERSTDHKASH